MAAFVFGSPPKASRDLTDAVIVNASEDPTVATVTKGLGWLRVASQWSVRFVAIADDDVLLDPVGLVRDLDRRPDGGTAPDLWGAIEFASCE